jgi:DNA-binding transcriptional LysR family regulator
MRDRMLAVASPEYLSKHGVPRAQRDLKSHRCLMGFARGELPATHWPSAEGGQLHMEGVFFSNEVTLLHEAALRGLGIALLPGMIVRPSIDSGRLVRVLPGLIEVETHIAAVYPEREFVPPQVRAFVDALAAWAETDLPKAASTRDTSRSATPAPGATPHATPTPRATTRARKQAKASAATRPRRSGRS